MKKPFDIFWTLESRDNAGRIAERRHFRANSLLGNFVSWMWARGFAGDVGGTVYTGTFKNTAGAVVNFNSGQNWATNYGATSGDANVSIVLGTGNAANVIDQFVLSSLIAHGVGAGQLNYGATSMINPVAGTNPRSFSWSRIFGGNAVDGVVVQELGMIMNFTNLPMRILVERSVIAPFNIPSGGSATCTWTVGVSI